MSDAPVLAEDEIEACEAFAAKHGIPALLDHLGFDGLGSEVNELLAKYQNIKHAYETLIGVPIE